MLLLPCPFCGDRNESEFVFGGPKRAPRLSRLDGDDGEWIDHLTVVPNPRGTVSEKWWHRLGCGSWIVVERDTVTHAIAKPASGLPA